MACQATTPSAGCSDCSTRGSSRQRFSASWFTQQVIDQGGDYVLALKDNQGTLHADVRSLFDDPACQTTRAQTIDGDHGRIETRTAIISTDSERLQEGHRWPGPAAIGKVVRIHETATETTTDQARARLRHGPQNLAILRHMALNVMQKERSKDSLRGSSNAPGGTQGCLVL